MLYAPLPWAMLDVSSIPNVCILEALVRHIHQMHKATAANERRIFPMRPLPKKVEDHKRLKKKGKLT